MNKEKPQPKSVGQPKEESGDNEEESDQKDEEQERGSKKKGQDRKAAEPAKRPETPEEEVEALIREFSGLKNKISGRIEPEYQPVFQEISQAFQKIDQFKAPGTGTEKKQELLTELRQAKTTVIEKIDQIEKSLLTDLQKVEKGLEKLNFIDIDPNEIFKLLDDRDKTQMIEALKKNIQGDAKGWEEFKAIIGAKLEQLGQDKNINLKNQISAVQTGVFLALQQRLEQEAVYKEMEQSWTKKLAKWWDVGKDVVKKGGKNLLYYGGYSAVVGVVGAVVGLSGTWIPTAFAGLTITGYKLWTGRKKDQKGVVETAQKSPREPSKKQKEKFQKLQIESLESIFVNGDQDFNKIMSNMMSDQLRVNSSPEAQKALKAYEKATKKNDTQANEQSYKEVEQALDGVSKEIYLSALNFVKSEYKNAPIAEQQNMAVVMATTLGMYQKREAKDASQVQELISGDKKPGFIRALNKFLDLRGASKLHEQETKGQKVAYALGAGLVSAGVLALITQSRWAGTGLAALGGLSAGWGYAERAAQIENEKKEIEEIKKIIDETEKQIGAEVSFDPKNIEAYRNRVNQVKARMDLGLLQKTPDLELRARNLIQRVTMLELGAKGAWDGLLKNMEANTAKQVAEAKVVTDKFAEGSGDWKDWKKNWKKWAYAGGGALGMMAIAYAGRIGVAQAREHLSGIGTGRSNDLIKGGHAEKENDLIKGGHAAGERGSITLAEFQKDHSYLAAHGLEARAGAGGVEVEVRGQPLERECLYLLTEAGKHHFAADGVSDLDKTRLLNMAANMVNDLRSNRVPGASFEAHSGRLVIHNFDAFTRSYADKQFAHAEAVLNAGNYTRSGAYAYVGNIREDHFRGINLDGQAVGVDHTNMEAVNSARDLLVHGNLERYGFQQGMIDDNKVNFDQGRGFHEYNINFNNQKIAVDFANQGGKMVLTQIEGQKLAKPLELDLSQLKDKSVVQQIVQHQCKQQAQGVGLTPDQYHDLAYAKGVAVLSDKDLVISQKDTDVMQKAIGEVKAYSSQPVPAGQAPRTVDSVIGDLKSGRVTRQEIHDQLVQPPVPKEVHLERKVVDYTGELDGYRSMQIFRNPKSSDPERLQALDTAVSQAKEYYQINNIRFTKGQDDNIYFRVIKGGKFGDLTKVTTDNFNDVARGTEGDAKEDLLKSLGWHETESTSKLEPGSGVESLVTWENPGRAMEYFSDSNQSLEHRLGAVKFAVEKGEFRPENQNMFFWGKNQKAYCDIFDGQHSKSVTIEVTDKNLGIISQLSQKSQLDQADCAALGVRMGEQGAELIDQHVEPILTQEAPIDIQHMTGKDLHFIDSYTPEQRGEIIKYFNYQSQVRDALPKILAEYKEQYGGRGEFNDLQSRVQHQIDLMNGHLNDINNAVGNPDKRAPVEDITSYMNRRGQQTPEEFARSFIEKNGKDVGLIDSEPVVQHIEPTHPESGEDQPAQPGEVSDQGQQGESAASQSHEPEVIPTITEIPRSRDIDMEGVKYYLEFQPNGKLLLRVEGNISGTEYQNVLNEDWRTKILNNSGLKSKTLAWSVVKARAQNIYLEEKLLNSDQLSEAEKSAVRESIEKRIEMTEQTYGDVFKEIK